MAAILSRERLSAVGQVCSFCSINCRCMRRSRRGICGRDRNTTSRRTRVCMLVHSSRNSGVPNCSGPLLATAPVWTAEYRLGPGLHFDPRHNDIVVTFSGYNGPSAAPQGVYRGNRRNGGKRKAHNRTSLRACRTLVRRCGVVL
jgi:hypothetical protein